MARPLAAAAASIPLERSLEYSMILELNLRIAGILLLALAILNLFLPKHFKWGEELQSLTLLTRQVFIVHCCFIFLIVAMMGFLALLYAPLLLEHSPLAQLVLLGFALFWTVRLIFQLFVYSPKLWRGDRFRTAMHALFSCMWTYFAAVFAAAWWQSRS
jgi:hypothetical protein